MDDQKEVIVELNSSFKEELDTRAIFDIGFQVVKKNWILIAIYSLIITAIVSLVYNANFINFDTGLSSQFQEITSMYESAGISFSETANGMIQSLLTAFVVGATALVFTRMTLNYVENRPFTGSDLIKSHKTILKYIWSILVLFFLFIPIMFLFGLVAFLSSGALILLTLVFLVAVMWLSINLSFFQNVIAHTGLAGVSAFKLSRTLVRGRFAKTLLVVIIGVALTVMFGEITSYITHNLIEPNNVSYFIIDFLTTMLGAYLAISVSVWYFNRYFLIREESKDNNVTSTNQTI